MDGRACGRQRPDMVIAMPSQPTAATCVARAAALGILLLATGDCRAADDFWTLQEKGEMNGKPELAYAHYLETFETGEPTVFCHVTELRCGGGGERDATPEQLAEVQEMIAALRQGKFFTREVFQRADVQGDKATLHFSADGNDGQAVTGTVTMERHVYGYWRIIEQMWGPVPKQ